MGGGGAGGNNFCSTLTTDPKSGSVIAAAAAFCSKWMVEGQSFLLKKKNDHPLQLCQLYSMEMF